MTVETWWPVIGWEGMYSVSSHGRLKSHARTVRCFRLGQSYVLRIPERIVTGSPNTSGHIEITLAPHGAGRRDRVVRFLHHLVLEAFDGFRPPGLEGCHRDDDKSHNAITNLRWDTRSSNIRDRIINGISNGGRPRKSDTLEGSSQ